MASNNIVCFSYKIKSICAVMLPSDHRPTRSRSARASVALAFACLAAPMAFADEHWWVLARGTDFKTYDKCVPGDRLASPTQALEAEKALGWAPQLVDKGDEIDVLTVKLPFPFRWFRSEEICQAAAKSQ